MNNMPEVKVGIVAVSRDCFPESLSVNRRKALIEAYKAKYDPDNIYECPICIVERKRSGSFANFKALRADLFPLFASVSSRDLRAETIAISDMASIPLKMISPMMIRNSMC